jgi:hypothetical protein
MAIFNEIPGFTGQFIASAGEDPNNCYNRDNRAYYLKKGTPSIKIFLSLHPRKDQTTVIYLRVFPQVLRDSKNNKEEVLPIPATSA